MRIFISSTCYDLIDLRAELESFFKSAGVEPVLSDSLTSDFQILPDANSIETCLANVRTCDHLIIILSNRYGPTLGKVGYVDVSATHLEYLEAKKAGIPIHMYVRDRLEGDFSIWKSNTDKANLKLSWCKSQSDWKIFELLEAHSKLKDAGGNNWLWPFRNSVELKDRIRRDFKETFARAEVQALFKAGNLPLIEVKPSLAAYHDSINFRLHLRNVGQSVAVSPTLRVIGSTNQWQIKTLHPKEDAQVEIEWTVPLRTKVTLEIQLSYSTLQGFKFADDATLEIWDRAGCIELVLISYALKGRRYLGDTDAALLIMPSFDGTKS